MPSICQAANGVGREGCAAAKRTDEEILTRGGNSQLAQGGDVCERQTVSFDVGTRERKETKPQRRKNIQSG